MADLLSIGITGLNVSKKALETTGHNLANANTDGYSRQKVNQTTNTPITKGGLNHGTGARIVSVTRSHDPFIEKRLNATISDHEFFDERAQQLSQVEDIFNEIDNEGLNKILNRFYNSFRELANQPENETIRSVVRDNAALVAKDFHRIRETVDLIAKNIDKKIEIDTDSINQVSKQISTLNKKIAALEAVSGETGDLRDQRDLAIRTLSEYFSVTAYTDDRGNFNVSAKGVGTLVSGAEVQEIIAVSKSKKESSNNMAGSYEIYFKNRPQTPISRQFKGGTFTSMLKVRNDDIRKIQDDIDELAYEFVNTTNSVHKKGYVNRDIKVDEQGNTPASDSKGPVTGVLFFEELESKEGAALKIDISDAVKDDLSNISTALSPNSPGDNRVAIGISKIQHEKILDGGTTTIEEKFLQAIGHIGLKTGKAKLDAEQSQGILAQTESLRERMSGVSIDEETANLVRYQHAYEASAKVLKSADEMFRTVLQIMP